MPCVTVTVIIIFITNFSNMTFPVEQIQTLEERLCIRDKLEKPPSEERADVATINTKSDYCKEKRDIQQADKCGTSAKKRKTDKRLTYGKLEKSSLPGTSRVKHQAYLQMALS